MDNATTHPSPRHPSPRIAERAAAEILDHHAQGAQVVRIIARPDAAAGIATAKEVRRRIDGATLPARLGRELGRLAGLDGPAGAACEAPAPYRAPHYSASLAALRGRVTRGELPRPGEISLAHGGVLVLDDCAMFTPDTLRTLRADLARGCVDLGGVAGAWTYPAIPAIVLPIFRPGEEPPGGVFSAAPAVHLD